MIVTHSYAHCSMLTHIGHVRADNEDTIAVSEADCLPLVHWSGVVPLPNGWALVADGMGGHDAGEVASGIAVELLRPVLATLTNGHEIALALNATNDALFDTMLRHPEFKGMGTTIAGVIFRGDYALAWNVGDSRIYLHHDGKLTQISVDDAAGGNMLTQCLGGFVRQPRLDPHVQEIRTYPGAQLLLCTDGLTDMVTDEHIAKILRQSGNDPAPFLVSAALDAGGIDNISVVVISVPHARKEVRALTCASSSNRQ